MQNLDRMAERTGLSRLLLQEIRDLAERSGLETVILFGSRSRGDYSRASDIDLAVRGGDITAFALDVEEKTSTLLTYDVIDLGKPVQAALRKAIDQEGILIYEKIR